jgi:ATP-dependent DNA helicase RecG
MIVSRLKNWIEKGESERMEFKVSFNQETIETLTAFANNKGGVVLLGVDDNKVIKGVQASKESINHWVNEVKSKTAPQIIPDIEVFMAGKKTVIAMAVAEYPVKPVSCRGRYYKRIGSSNHTLSIQEVINIHLQSVNSSWDFYIRPNKTLSDISLRKVNKIIEQISNRKQIPIQDDPFTFLKKYSLVDGEKITNACWLMFLPEQDVNTTIELGHFASPVVIKDSLTLKNDLFTEVEEVMAFIRKHINKEIIITGDPQSTERWQYPLEAIRELVLNMIVHRDYTSSYDSVIKIFKDHIEFYNPGAFPDTISIDQLLSNDYISQPRNKQIAEMFKEAGMIEKYGSGVNRVCRSFIDYGLPVPEYTKLPDGVIIKVFSKATVNDLVNNQGNDLVNDLVNNLDDNLGNNQLNDPGNDLGNDLESDLVNNQRSDLVNDLGSDFKYKLSENQKKILEKISENGHVTQKELSKYIGITEKNIRININKLKQIGFLERVGSDKKGYWQVIEK